MTGPSAVLPDTDALPLTQHLVMEVLAARWRVGESVWTFTSRARKALVELERAGYLRFKSGIVERTFLAWMTPEGLLAATSDAYIPPNARDGSQPADALVAKESGSQRSSTETPPVETP